MSKKLRTVQKVAKVLSVLTTIAFVMSIIGLIGCALILPLFILMGSVEVTEGVTFSDYILSSSGVGYEMFIYVLAVAIVALIGGIVVLSFARKYFAIELRDGTPFSDRGATAMRNLGWASLITSVITSIVSSAVASIFIFLLMDIDGATASTVSVDLTAAFAFFILAAIFRYGAELERKAKEQEAANTQPTPIPIQFPPIRPGK